MPIPVTRNIDWTSICRTTAPVRKLPAIVMIHGGGWRAGGKSDVALILMPLIRSGRYAGVSIDYRWSSEARWPAQIYDCKAAIRWVRANAAKYAIDADRVGVWGLSAGGHLALMLGLSANLPELEGEIGPYRGTGSQVAAVVNFFGVSDLLSLAGPSAEKSSPGSGAAVEALMGGPLPQNIQKAAAASPLTYVTADNPPVMTVHGTLDSIVPYEQSVLLDAALRKAGVPSYFITVKGGGHGDFGAIADDRVKAFFDKVLRGQDVQISIEPLTYRPSSD